MLVEASLGNPDYAVGSQPMVLHLMDDPAVLPGAVQNFGASPWPSVGAWLQSEPQCLRDKLIGFPVSRLHDLLGGLAQADAHDLRQHTGSFLERGIQSVRSLSMIWFRSRAK